MATDALLEVVVGALADLAVYVDSRPEDATADDDVKALEDVAYRLQRLSPADQERLRTLFGDDLSTQLGLAQ